MDTFTCDSCGGTFKKAWTDEEADAEFKRLFPHELKRVTVCDDCYDGLKAGLVKS